MENKVICENCGSEGYSFGEVRPNDKFICLDCFSENEDE